MWKLKSYFQNKSLAKFNGTMSVSKLIQDYNKVQCQGHWCFYSTFKKLKIIAKQNAQYGNKMSMTISN